MSWWRKSQQVMMKPSVRLKKSVSDTVSLLQKRGDDLAKRTSKDLQNRMEKGVSNLGTRAGNVSSSLKMWTVDLGQRTRKRTEKAMSQLSSKVVQEARALPSKTAEATKQAAMGAAVAGTNAAKSAASAGAQAVTDAGRQASNRARDAMPKLGDYMTLTFRRIAYLVFGTAFLYGMGTSLPGAVARYYTEKDRRREEARISAGREGDESDSLALSSEDNKGVGAVQERSQSPLELIYRWFRNQ